MAAECGICLGPIRTRVLLSCGHSSLCLSCFIRLVKCYSRFDCPICQRVFQEAAATRDPALSFKCACRLSRTVIAGLNLYIPDPDIRLEFEALHPPLPRLLARGRRSVRLRGPSRRPWPPRLRNLRGVRALPAVGDPGVDRPGVRPARAAAPGMPLLRPRALRLRRP
jgi:hypothetical protein